MSRQTWIWSWGAGTRGQLASDAFVDSLEPVLLSSFAETLIDGSSATPTCPPVLDMACGGAHAAAVLLNEGEEHGQVISWGNGESGALGHGKESDVSVPKVLQLFNSINVCSVAAGWSHSAFVTDSGELYTCGSGSFGQLGHGDCEERLIPTKVEFFSGKPVSMAACGMRHTLILADAQGTQAKFAVFSFGASRRGQLGLANTDIPRKDQSRAPKVVKVSVPQEITVLTGHQVVLLTANGDHSAAITEGGDLYIWGRGFCGESDLTVPTRATPQLCFSKVALGWNHGLALTDEGVLWAWGSNQRGQLGSIEALQSTPISRSSESCLKEGGSCNESSETSENQQWPEMIRVHGLEGKKVVCLSAGSEHSAAFLEDGELMVWGWGEHGQLGLGITDDAPIARAVTLPGSFSKEELSWRVFCGSGFTFVVAETSPNV